MPKIAQSILKGATTLGQLGTEMKAANTLLDLFRDNLPLLLKIDEKSVKRMVQFSCPKTAQS